MRTRMLALLVLLAIAGCGTPEIARERETRPLLPREIEEALRSDDPARRADAAGQVEAMDPEARRRTLLELLGDDRPHVRLMAVGILARHHGQEDTVVERLGQALSLDPDPDVRGALVDALAGSGRLGALGALVTALETDPSLLVKRRIARALDRITGQTFGAAFADRVDEAELSADEAMIDYASWLPGQDLRWDAAAGRFVPREAGR